MTAKEQAFELVNRFHRLVWTDENSKIIAKKCALLCVDEMMHDIRFHLAYGYKKRLEFWQNVKIEINNL